MAQEAYEEGLRWQTGVAAWEHAADEPPPKGKPTLKFSVSGSTWE